jgi:hypothetical protein
MCLGGGVLRPCDHGGPLELFADRRLGIFQASCPACGSSWCPEQEMPDHVEQRALPVWLDGGLAVRGDDI